MAIMETIGISKQFGGLSANKDINCRFEEGKITSIIGPNGAGKTTCMHTITRLPPPEAPRVIAGDITFQGKSILATKPSDVVKNLHLALSPEGRRIFGNLTVMENLKLATYARDKDADLDAEYERIFDLFPRLKERRNQRSESLSGGEQQMLAVGRALMTGCNILLLDEPSMGLAPVLKYELFRKLKQLNEEGMTILLVEQNANLALHLAHRGYVLDTGTIVAEGTSEELLGNPEVKKAYLGG